MTARPAILLLVFIASARIAAAQSIILTPSDPKRWDTTVTIGWLSGNKEGSAERWNDWYDTFATSIDVGRYWTPSLKTELGATLTTEGTVYSQEQVVVPGRPPIFISREHHFGVRALNASAAWQFLENTWVHPFVAAGVQAAWERSRVSTYPYPDSPFPLPPTEAPRTRVDVRPFLSGGAKFYVTERGFLRTDLSTSLDANGAARVWWRIGGGLDF